MTRFSSDHAAPTRRGALALGALAGLAAAVPRRARAQGAGEAVLRVVAPWEFTSPEPTDMGYILARLGVAETLVQVRPDGQLVGGVAEGWAVDPDRLTWRFRVRTGRSFHDGTPVTPEAVAASLRRAFAGESLSAVPLADLAAQGGEVVVRTRTPFSVLPAFFADYASIVLAPSAYGPDGKVARPVGSGPYRVTGVQGVTTLELERFETYAGGPAPIARARYTAVPNGDTRANIALAGDADLVFTLAPSAMPRIRATPGMGAVSLTIPRIRPLAFNCGLPQFEDVRVRRAVSLGIDREGIARGILRDPASAATQLLPPVLSAWHDPSLAPLAHDPAAAARLLDEAGWVPGPDGVRAKGGVRLAAKLLTVANRPELPVMATAIQAQLRRLGIEIAIEAGPGSIIPAAIGDGTMQMTMFARTYVNVPEVIATIIPDYTRERSTWGALNWAGRTRMKPLTDAYVGSFDEAEKARLRGDILRLIREEMPVIPVSWFEHTLAVSDRVRGLVVDPYEMRYLLDRLTWA